MCGFGWSLFFPLAVSYRLTKSLREKRWTVEQVYWRWQEKQKGTTDAFRSVIYTGDSEFGKAVLLVWKDKVIGKVVLISGDKKMVLAKDLAREVSRELDIPLTDWKQQPLTE